MVVKMLGVGAVLAAGVLIAGCSSESPTQISASGADTRTTALLLPEPPDGPLWRGPDWHNVPISMIKKPDGTVEILRKTLDSKIMHFRWTEPAESWTTVASFGTNVLSDAALCLNSSTGNLQAVIRENNGNPNGLAHWERVNGVWGRKTVFGSNCTGSPTMLHNNNPSAKYLEVVSWTANNKLAHYTKKSSWVLTATITPPSTHVIVQNPVIAQDANGNMVLAALSIDSSSTVNLLVYHKAAPNGAWTRQSMANVAPPQLNRWIRPSICSYGTQGWFSILAVLDQPDRFYEYRTKSGFRYVEGGEVHPSYIHASIGQISHVMKSTNSIYIAIGQDGVGSGLFTAMKKYGYVDGK
jgi:hypothetical protein